jgi:hypothetical protein
MTKSEFRMSNDEEPSLLSIVIPSCFVILPHSG